MYIQIPGDKSITHRALILSLFTQGEDNIIEGFNQAKDCLSTIECLKALGLVVKNIDGRLITYNPDWKLNYTQNTNLDGRNSGTTIRLLAGVLAGAAGEFLFTGDDSLRKRPMARLVEPLRLMGAKVKYLDKDGYLPFSLTGGKLTGIKYKINVASAQVQSAIILAGLKASNCTIVSVPSLVRTHTQNMLKANNVIVKNLNYCVTGVKRLNSPVAGFNIKIPGDLSSASYFLVLGALLKNSHFIMENININPGRDLIIDTILKIGGDLKLLNRKIVNLEPVCDLEIRGNRKLTATTIDYKNIATGIDEIPVIALLMSQAMGTSYVKNAQELMYKESNRLDLIVSNLRQAGAEIKSCEDGFWVKGVDYLHGDSIWVTSGDHRMAMTGLIASAMAKHPIKVDNLACIDISYPGFLDELDKIMAKIK